MARRDIRRLAGALLLFGAVVWVLHFRLTSPQLIYCEDVAGFHLPRRNYAYRHPWEAFLGAASSSHSFGVASYAHDGMLERVVPLVPAVLSSLAPDTRAALARFDWRTLLLAVGLWLAGEAPFNLVSTRGHAVIAAVLVVTDQPSPAAHPGAA